MVWFQCEDCGENLKKPKLPNHFRGCSARKLSCIDCGVVFNQQSVQGHTQCISEAEKYGPKSMGCIKKETMKTVSGEQNCDNLDVSLGLSARAPWSCSLCNVKATSQETLMLHSQGKKHRSKVRSMSSKLSNGSLASKSTLGTMETVPSSNKSTSDVKQDIIAVSLTDELDEKNLNNSKWENGSSTEKTFARIDDGQRQHEGAVTYVQPESNQAVTYGSNKKQTVGEKKKRKRAVEQDRPPSSATREAEFVRNGGEASCTLMGGELSGSVKLLEDEQAGCGKHMVDEDMAEAWSRVVKWKKIIRRTLKNAPNGSLRIKQLRSSVLPLVVEVVKKSGLEVSKGSFCKELEKQIHSQARLIIDGRNVRLAVKGAEK
eukprot:c2923_g1_i1 orf=310-1431(-)